MAERNADKLALKHVEQRSEPKKESQSNAEAGQALLSSSLSMRISRGLDGVVAFGALYLTTLFSLDSWTAARDSPFSNGYREPYGSTNHRVDRDGGRSRPSGGFGTFRTGPSMPAPVVACGSCG